MSQTLRRLLIAGVLVGIVLGVAFWLRRSLGIELDATSLREFVTRMGIFAPVAFVAIATFRLPLALPSALLLTVAGLCFGTLMGAVYGALGISFSSVLTFVTARYTGRDAVMARLPARTKLIVEGVSGRLGAVFLAIGTAYPISPITGLHAAAGVTAMAFGWFYLSVLVGGLVRSGLYTYFGNSLFEGDLQQILVSLVLLGCVTALPLAFPQARARLREMFDPARAEELAKEAEAGGEQQPAVEQDVSASQG